MYGRVIRQYKLLGRNFSRCDSSTGPNDPDTDKIRFELVAQAGTSILTCNLNTVPTPHTARLVQLRRGGSFVYCLHSATLPTRQATTSSDVELATLKKSLTRSFPSCDIRCVGFLQKCAHSSQSISLSYSELSGSVYVGWHFTGTCLSRDIDSRRIRLHPNHPL